MVDSILNSFLLSLPFFIFYLPTTILCQVQQPFSGGQGQWQFLQENTGISAMHMQVLSNNRVVMYDRTNFGYSNISLSGGRCRHNSQEKIAKVDCTAHSILYDFATNTFRTLMVQTDTWCSSGAVIPNGTLIQTGGWGDGELVHRELTPCLDKDNCDWIEFPNSLARARWYATNHILPDGRIIIVGGRRQYNYEFYPNPSRTSFRLRFLRETRDVDSDENNLYPFLHLLPDGNLFIFANTRSILLDYNRNRIVKEFPRIPGNDPRNYPSTGSSVLLPLDENKDNMEVEIVICGGAMRSSALRNARGEFLPALSSCGRLTVSDENPKWVMEDMPIPRVISDMLFLPTGDIIIINGAASGVAGWDGATDPVLTPVIYRPFEHPDWRFAVMSSATRPRMYHSSAVLLPDGRVLVAGSNPHRFYEFTNVNYPTDLSLEAFSPPYLSIEYNPVRPRIMSVNAGQIGYGRRFEVKFNVDEYLGDSVLSIRIIFPSFTTHSFAMNQRMVVLRLTGMDTSSASNGVYSASVVGPSTPEIAPPGHYMLFVVHAGTPSPGVWVRV